jgi:outer membrane protein assembly factor BamB
MLTVAPQATPSPQASATQGTPPQQASATAVQSAWDRNWPTWRGPAGIGISTTANPPTEWSETKNIRWKVEIPGRGHSTPIVWGDRVYVTTAVPVGVTGDAQHAPRGSVAQRGVHRFVVMALDRKTGKTVWERTVKEAEPHEKSHVDNGTWASSSPFTDGERLYAYFESFGLYALDMQKGTLIWEKDLGDKRMRNEFGEGSTPALHGNTIVVVWDNLNAPSFIAALDKRDGKELWRKERKEIDTWATPLILTVNGRPQAIVPAMERVRSYDLATGDVVWESKGLTMNPIPSPVHADGLVFLMAGFRGNDLKAIRIADAKGDIDGTPAIAWTFDRDTPYVPSPIVVNNVLYFLKSNSGILSAFDARTGKPLFQNQRLEGVANVFASPVSAGGRVYIPGQDGGTIVFKAGPAFEVIATNQLDDAFDASPALVDNELFLRGRKHLYAIASQ